jgi:ATPase subunit of ABC transporter with duplicated ATPase domains
VSKDNEQPKAPKETIVRFDRVSFEWSVNKPILDEVSFSIRRGAKLTLMGQNGAGKSTIFGLIMGVSTPESGIINKVNNLTVAISRQVIPKDELNLTVRTRKFMILTQRLTMYWKW